MRPVILIGYRGAGKTAAARCLARRWSCDWADADEELERRAGMTIRRIFEVEGEVGFRDRESNVLADLCRPGGPRVLATGGGVVLRLENRELLRAGRVVWLAAPAATLWERMRADVSTAERRPNLAQGGLAEVEALLRVREPLYRACADLIIDTSAQAPEEIAAVIDAAYGPAASAPDAGTLSGPR